MLTNGLDGLVGALPGDIVLVHWGDAHHGNDTWYTWPELEAYHAQGDSPVEQVGYFVSLSETVLTLVSSHGPEGTNAPWNIPRAWIHGTANIYVHRPGEIPWP